ncbi:cation-translocating P-type ATPase [Crenobacter cavernae]|uniref:Cation-transporting P-type ATPase n=1 Tax=Crenobacter cavernae TaxID=2290923 RepID=A0ABY0FD59_9NEIS|nr:cation-transporting P-type ATPase [Crenobacter cavernae]RXZ44118.1 cation-transporting P-type ATPase [Crenobacter cavernae]
MRDWHAMDTAQVLEEWDVDATRGLGEAAAAARLKKYGINRPSVRQGRSPLVRFLSQIVQPLVLVLVGAGCVTAVLGEWVDTGVIFGVVLLNAAFGFIQEGKAEVALAALARAVSSEASVLRDGMRRRLDAAELVPGDIVLLSAGDKVPADLRLLGGRELRTAEAALTGESVPVDKRADPLPADTLLADRHNMAYAGTLAVAGQGTGVVVATGDNTEVGRISQLIAQRLDLTTPLTRKMGVFARYLLVAILMLAGLTFVVGVQRGESAFDMFMAAVALAVGAIPEGLPAAMTVTLATGVARMAKRRAIIRKLTAVEILGSTTVICSDKTGTLTENEMTVREIWAGKETFTVTGHGYGPAGRIEQGSLVVTPAGALRETLLAGVLCNDARLVHEGQHWTVAGDPTEGAILTLARKGKLDEATLRSVFPRLDELPFDSMRQYMATLHEIGGLPIVYAKGAAERLLPACWAMLDAQGNEIALDPGAIEAAANRMAREGLRVLALVRSEIALDQRLEHIRMEDGLMFLGLIGMIDPPRPRAMTSVRTCHAAGIRVKMITGDHPGTAIAIARQLGIASENASALTGRDLARLDEDALRKAVAEVDVFARVEPEQKLRLVQALQDGGEVVAMTGDGVNDAPALKQADIGIAMGAGGTEVAKEAAAMILTDDNFATIEAAVEEGRGIYDNIVKFITWTIPTNAGEGLVILAAILTGTTLPITPLQILWINMTTAILLGMMLAFEPAERGIMQRPPRSPAAPILDRVLVQRILLVSVLLLSGAFGLFELALQQGHSLAQARTVAVNVFVLVQTGYLFNCRSLTQPVWSVAPFSNPSIWIGSGAMVALQIAFTYVPAFNRIFHTAPIGFTAWLPIVAFAVACLAIIEAEKKWYAR